MSLLAHWAINEKFWKVVFQSCCRVIVRASLIVNLESRNRHLNNSFSLHDTLWLMWKPASGITLLDFALGCVRMEAKFEFNGIPHSQFLHRKKSLGFPMNTCVMRNGRNPEIYSTKDLFNECRFLHCLDWDTHVCGFAFSRTGKRFRIAWL